MFFTFILSIFNIFCQNFVEDTLKILPPSVPLCLHSTIYVKHSGFRRSILYFSIHTTQCIQITSD